MKAAIKIDGGLAAVKTQLIDGYKTVLKETGNQGLLSSLWSLVSSSAGPPQLWDIKVWKKGRNIKSGPQTLIPHNFPPLEFLTLTHRLVT